MKKIISSIAVTIILLSVSNQGSAQAWEKSTKVLGIGIGAASYFHVDNYYADPYWGYHRGWYNPLTGQFIFQGEFGVHKYVGIGFSTGLGGRSGWGLYYSGELNIPIGVLANFHFYQLIADKTGKNIHADKLDIYAGANIGSGVAFIFDNNSRAIPIAFGGVQAGVRYYFSPKVGVTGEVGFGKSIVNAGLVFKL